MTLPADGPDPSAPVRARRDANEKGRTRDLSRPPAPEPLPVAVVDSHCHLDIRDGDDWFDVDTALAESRAVGVDRIVQVAYDLETSYWGVAAARDRAELKAAVALHPNEAPRIHAEEGATALEDALAQIEALAADPGTTAIGETGLDHFRTGPEGRAVQEESFRRHIAIAKAVGKPLVIHDRDSHDDVLRVLREEGAPDVVVFHCFSGDAAMARECVGAGYHLSFAGTVTFKNAAELREALVLVPDELLLVETDAPFLTPAPYRGRPNASYLVPVTVRAMAETRGQDLAELCTALSETSERVFGPFA